MAKRRDENTRIKREYYQFLREARGRSEASIDAVASALDRFDKANSNKDYRTFHRAQAVAFKRKLGETRNAQTGQPLSKSTVSTVLRALREFFNWLAGRPGYKSKIQYSDADYFNPTEKDRAIARAKRQKIVPTLDQMQHILGTMPHGTPIEMRDRAVLAFALLTGARVKALISFRLHHVDLEKEMVFQDAREVETKFAKTFPTWFFPVGSEPKAIFLDWVSWLRSEFLWGGDDPLFPATKIERGAAGGFEAVGIERKPWSTSEPVRRILRSACEAAGQPYFNPHSIRDMIVRMAFRMELSNEEMKSWSQNLGHKDLMTTYANYGEVPAERQGKLIRRLSKQRGENDPLDDFDVNSLIAGLTRFQEKIGKNGT